MDKDEWWRLRGSTCAEEALLQLQDEEVERAERAALEADVARDLPATRVDDVPAWETLDSMYLPGALPQ